MKSMKLIAAALLFAASTALAQVHDNGAGGGAYINITAGSINCNASGAGGCTITPNTTMGITGTTTNDSANAGSIGQIVSATVASNAALTLTTATGTTITTVSLTAGDWDCRGQAQYAASAATTTAFLTGLSLTSTAFAGQTGGVGLGTDPQVNGFMPLTTTTYTLSQSIPPVRVSLASTASLFLVAQGTFSAGSETGYGSINCRRVR